MKRRMLLLHFKKLHNPERCGIGRRGLEAPEYDAHFNFPMESAKTHVWLAF